MSLLLLILLLILCRIGNGELDVVWEGDGMHVLVVQEPSAGTIP